MTSMFGREEYSLREKLSSTAERAREIWGAQAASLLFAAACRKRCRIRPFQCRIRNDASRRDQLAADRVQAGSLRSPEKEPRSRYVYLSTSSIVVSPAKMLRNPS